MKEKISTENEAMTIIAFSGEGRSKAFEAIEVARTGAIDDAKKLLEVAKESSIKAHQAQTDLLVREAQGVNNDINMLLIHAQDHLMTSKLAIELIEEMVHLYDRGGV